MFDCGFFISKHSPLLSFICTYHLDKASYAAGQLPQTGMYILIQMLFLLNSYFNSFSQITNCFIGFEIDTRPG